MRRLLWIAPIVASLAAVAMGRPLSARSADSPPPPKCLQPDASNRCFSPAEIRKFYGISPLIQRGATGKGRTIAIIVSFGSPTLRDDLHTFDQTFSLPDPTLDIRAPLGTKANAGSGWTGETSLDVEWAHAMAPQARILLLTSPVDETEGVQGLPEFLKLERYALSHHADVISQSWAATEDTLFGSGGRAVVKQFHQLYADAAKQGVTAVGASGDTGAAGLDMSLHKLYPYRVAQFPASDPLVLAVGGTQLIAGTTRQNEVAWSGSGGGFSKLYAEPSYQRGLPAATQKLLHGRRGVPDVAMTAARESALPVHVNGRWFAAGGTSASAPLWSGLIALADSAAGRRLGDIHAALYRLARSRQYGSVFHDITTGTIKDPVELQGKQKPLHAGLGWDPATGLGTPNGANLVASLIKK